MKPTEQIKYIVDQIVIAYCNLKKFGDKNSEKDFDIFTAQLMQITGLDYEGTLEYACDVLVNRSKQKGVA